MNKRSNTYRLAWRSEIYDKHMSPTGFNELCSSLAQGSENSFYRQAKQAWLYNSSFADLLQCADSRYILISSFKGNTELQLYKKYEGEEFHNDAETKK